jgi:hypothetical protein
MCPFQLSRGSVFQVIRDQFWHRRLCKCTRQQGCLLHAGAPSNNFLAVSIKPSIHLPLPKRPGKARPRTEKEVHMNTIITQNELNGLTDQELGELHQLLTLLLTEADPASQERRNILASLGNIARARAYKDRRQPALSP